MADKNYDDNNEELGKLVSNESTMTKFVKAGIIALAVSAVGKKASGTAVGKLLSSDTAKYSAIAVGTMALSNDDNKGGDLAVASSLIAGMAGIKTARTMIDTVEGMARVQKGLIKADEMMGSMSMKMFNLNEKIGETAKQSFAKNMMKNMETASDSTLSIAFGLAKTIGKTAFDVASAPLDNIKQFGFLEGMKQNIKNIDNTESMRLYNSLDDIERSQIKAASNMAMGVNSTKVFKDDDGFLAESLEKVSSLFGQKGMFSNPDKTLEAKIEMAEKINKIHSIKTNSTFSDMGGIYTKYDVNTGKVNLDISKLGSDESSNVEMLNKLYKNYEKDASATLGKRTVVDVHGNPVFGADNKKIYKNKFDDLDDEKKEQGFLTYLNKNGFEGFVKENYKVEDAVTFDDVDKMFRNKTLAKDSTLEVLQTKTEDALKKGTLNQESFDKRMAMIDNLRDQKNMPAQDILDYVHNNLDNRNLKKFVEVDAENLYSTGIKNNNVLKNFTFTNVVTKSAEFGYSDKTALDGTIVGLKMLGIVENSFVGNFKIPLARSFNTWNPMKLLETDNRIKEKVANDFSKYGATSNGFILDGKMIQHQSYVEDVVTGNTLKKEYRSEYFSDGKDSYKRVFKKQSLDIIDDNYEVLKENEKSSASYRDVYNTFKEKGIKAAAEQASESQMNPYAFRYKKGKGMRMVNPEESYFNETPIWQGLFNNNVGGSKVLDVMDSKGKDTGILRRTANMILGEHGDINGRDLKIQNEFILGRRDTAEKTIYAQLLRTAQNDSAGDLRNPNTVNRIINEYGRSAEDVDDYMRDNTTMYGLSIKALRETGGDIMDQLEASAKGKKGRQAEVANWALAQIDTSGKNTKGRVDFLNSMKNLDAKNADQKHLIDFMEENADSFKRLNILSDFEASKTSGFKSLSSEDEALMLEMLSDTMKTGSTITGKDLLSMAVEKTVTNMRKNPEGMAGYNNAIKNSIAIEGDAGDTLENLLKFVKSVDKAKDNAIGSTAKQVSQHNLSNTSEVVNRIKGGLDSGEIADGNLKDMYDLNLGYELNHVLKNDDHVKGSLEYFDGISDALKGDGTPIGDLGYIKNDLHRGDKDFNRGNAGRIYDTVVSKKDQDTINKDFKTYDFFDDLNAKNEVPKGEKSNSFIEAVEIMKEAKFVKRKEALGNSLIVEDSLKEALNVKNVMEATRKFVQSFMDGNKRSFSSYKAIANTAEGDAVKILSMSKNFGEADSTFGLFMKTAINKVQAPLEFIGIERMTNKQLGSHWGDQYKNFFKYRYVPLAASVLAYNAVDSAADAVVPDEAGILGNGITGVATRTYATARVGLQYAAKYTGALAVIRGIDKIIPVDNGLTWMLDLTMDPEEMKDVYFNGKAVRVNKNRNWYTAGRQSGEGEEFGEYRPHLLYTMGNKTAGIYDNKIEKFFRQDFAVTKYPWYILDPYKEERDAYKKFGALYPKTEQMFKDVPMLGHLLSATVGEIIKPTRYIAEEMWRVGENMMKNPGYNPNDPNSPEFIEFSEPNKFLAGAFDAIEDYKTFSGMHGYMIGKATEMFFGKTNPYKDKTVLGSIDEDTSVSAQYENLQLGGMFGTTEGIRRLLDGESLGTISVNPLTQNLPDWMPEFYSKGQNPYMKKGFGQYIMPGEDFDKTYNATGNADVDKFKTLSMLAPYSKDFDQLKDSIQDNIGKLNKEEQASFYESLGYASDYNKRRYDDKESYASNIGDQNIKIDKKVSYNEFISGGKRYKIDNVEDNFNKLSEKIGGSRARKLINNFDSQFEEGSSYNFKMSSDAQYSVGRDRDGDYIKIGADSIDKRIKGNSVYNKEFSVGKVFGAGLRRVINSAMTADLEKVFGTKTAANEWSQENVQSPYFRDWDSLGSSFIEPYYNFSSNSLTSSMLFGRQASNAFMKSNSTIDVASTLVNAGRAKLLFNKISGGVTRSSSYENDADVNRELQKIKHVSGSKSYFNMTGSENLADLKSMVNESDAQFLEGLINTTNSSERAKILKFADTTTSGVLQRVWNKQQELIGNGNSDKMYDIEQETFDTMTDIGDYSGDDNQARIALKVALGVSKSKLDAKKVGMLNAYRGSSSSAEAEHIKGKLYKGYNSKSVTTSTIYPKGTININGR